MMDKYKDPKDGTALTKDVKRSEQLLMCPLLFYMRPMLQQSVRNIIYFKIKRRIRDAQKRSTTEEKTREINLLSMESTYLCRYLRWAKKLTICTLC